MCKHCVQGLSLGEGPGNEAMNIHASLSLHVDDCVCMHLAAVLCFAFVKAKFQPFFLRSPGRFPDLSQLQ